MGFRSELKQFNFQISDNLIYYMLGLIIKK